MSPSRLNVGDGEDATANRSESRLLENGRRHKGASIALLKIQCAGGWISFGILLGVSLLAARRPSEMVSPRRYAGRRDADPIRD